MFSGTSIVPRCSPSTLITHKPPGPFTRCCRARRTSSRPGSLLDHARAIPRRTGARSRASRPVNVVDLIAPSGSLVESDRRREAEPFACSNSSGRRPARGRRRRARSVDALEAELASRSETEPGMRRTGSEVNRAVRSDGERSGCSAPCLECERQSRGCRRAARATSELVTCSQTRRLPSASYVIPLHLLRVPDLADPSSSDPAANVAACR